MFRMVPTMANGQPAFAAYRRSREGAYEAHALQVLTVTATGVGWMVIFLDPTLFAMFGLPPRLAAETAPARR
jgi:RNA polymerase sigma-70 factor, ECF subfamily